MDVVVVPSSNVLASLKQVQRLPLSQITADQAQAVVRRLMCEAVEVPKVEVAAFSSFV